MLQIYRYFAKFQIPMPFFDKKSDRSENTDLVPGEGDCLGVFSENRLSFVKPVL